MLSLLSYSERTKSGLIARTVGVQLLPLSLVHTQTEPKLLANTGYILTTPYQLIRG